MQQRELGQSGIQVSSLCLGTMTWGEQNTQEQAFEQLDYALANGINFIDTAELYPVPPNRETYADTERIIGTWIARRSRRDDFVLASKIAGPTGNNRLDNYIRNGNDFSRTQIIQACNDSLKRLNTDYIDLYQLHWPERQTNCFGKLGFSAPDAAERYTPFDEVIDALSDLARQGKIRAYGLSNETPWGTFRHLNESEKQPEHRLRAASVQNPYNLLNRSYEVGMAEISVREHIPLLAYSPLAFGVLTGKYRHGARPAGARLTLFDRFTRYVKPKAVEAVERYTEVAEEAGLALTDMALAFVTTRPFIASNIIGATIMEQLAQNIKSADLVLSDDVLAAIDAVHAEISNPCP